MKCSDKTCNCYIFHEETINKVKSTLKEDSKIMGISNYLKVLADFTRIKILEAIKDEYLCVCDIGHLLGLTKSAISHQMKTFKKYKMVESKKEGKMVYYKLSNQIVSDFIDNVSKEVELI